MYLHTSIQYWHTGIVTCLAATECLKILVLVFLEVSPDPHAKLKSTCETSQALSSSYTRPPESCSRVPAVPAAAAACHGGVAGSRPQPAGRR